MHVVFSVALVVGYVALLAFVAVRARAAREYAEFSLAKRSLPLALIFGSLCAAYIGPGFCLGFVGKGFQSGLLFLCVGLAYALQNILVGVFVAPRLRSLSGCHTLGDAMGYKYNRACQVLAGIISVGLCTGFAAVMAKAAGVVVEEVFGIPMRFAVALIVLICTLYTTFGGLQTSVMTDALQFVLFTILMPVIFLFVLMFRTDGVVTFAREMAAATEAGLGATPPVAIVGLIAAFLLGETLIPPYANRALATRTTSASRNSFVLAGVFSALWFALMIALGIVARTIVPEGTPEDYVLLALIKTTMPMEGYALLLVALLSVIMSSLDSLLNAGAVSFTQDVVRPFAGISDGASLVCSRVATVAIAALAAAAAVAVPSIINGLLICYTIWAPAILPAAVLGLWLPQPRPLAAILSMATGAVVALLFQFAWPDATEIPVILLALAAALAAYLLGHVLAGFTESAQCQQ